MNQNIDTTSATYTVLGHNQCQYCKDAIRLLAEGGHSFIYLDARKPEQAVLVQQLRDAGMATVPRIWKRHVLIGGLTELKADMLLDTTE